jgi:hypothetical protein
MVDGTFRLDLLARAAALDLGYIAVGFVLFLWAFHRARERGSLLSSGE